MMTLVEERHAPHCTILAFNVSHNLPFGPLAPVLLIAHKQHDLSDFWNRAGTSMYSVILHKAVDVVLFPSPRLLSFQHQSRVKFANYISFDFNIFYSVGILAPHDDVWC